MQRIYTQYSQKNPAVIYSLLGAGYIFVLLCLVVVGLHTDLSLPTGAGFANLFVFGFAKAKNNS